MGRVNTPILSDSDRLALEVGFRSGVSHCFRNRCHVILLKADGRSSRDVGLITEMSHISVNSWVKRFCSAGISGLHTKPGQGRKPLLEASDKEGLLESIKSNGNKKRLERIEYRSLNQKNDIIQAYLMMGLFVRE